MTCTEYQRHPGSGAGGGTPGCQRLYQIEVDHVKSVIFDGNRLRELLGINKGKSMGQIIEITDFQAKALDVYARFYGKSAAAPGQANGGTLHRGESKVVMRAWTRAMRPVSILARTGMCRGEARELIARCPDIRCIRRPLLCWENLPDTTLSGASSALCGGSLCPL